MSSLIPRSVLRLSSRYSLGVNADPCLPISVRLKSRKTHNSFGKAFLKSLASSEPCEATAQFQQSAKAKRQLGRTSARMCMAFDIFDMKLSCLMAASSIAPVVLKINSELNSTDNPKVRRSVC